MKDRIARLLFSKQQQLQRICPSSLARGKNTNDEEVWIVDLRLTDLRCAQSFQGSVIKLRKTIDK
jgi:hypothetical protein